MSRIFFSSAFSTFSANSTFPVKMKGDTARLEISKGDEIIFSNMYEVRGEDLTVGGLSRIFETDLRKRNLSFSDYTFRLHSPSDTPVHEEMVTIIHCPAEMPEPAEDYLRHNFLIPPAGDVLSPGEPAAMELPEGFAWPLEIVVYLTESQYFKASSHTEEGLTAPFEELLAQGWRNEYVYSQGSSGSSPMVIHAECGAREANYVFLPTGGGNTAWSPGTATCGGSILFRFKNVFNCVDYIWLRGILESSPGATSQTVRCGGRLRKVDIKNDPEYTFTAECVSMHQAYRAMQLLTSHEVELLRTPDPSREGSLKTGVIITEVTGPVTYSPSEAATVKIKFKVSGYGRR